MYASYSSRKKPGLPWAAIIFGGVAFSVQLARWRWPQILGADWLNQWGVVPVRLFADRAGNAHGLHSLELPTLASALFIHVGFAHLVGNLVFLWLFARRVEQRLGWVFSLGMYLLAGIAANFWAAYLSPASAAPMIGSSGVTSALLGAFIVLFPGQRIGVIIPLGLYLHLIKVPALLLIGSWIGLQLMYTFLLPGIGAVAWWTHVAGFSIGLLAAAPAHWYRAAR